MSFLHIDLDRLEEEWVGQSPLFHKWARKLAEAKDEVANAEDNLELVQAQVSATVRSNPKKFGIVRISEKAIEEAVVRTKRYQEAKRLLREAKKKAGYASATVQALEHRKKALEDAVRLWSQDYYATPKTDSSTGTETKDRLNSSKKRAIRNKGRNLNDKEK